MTINKQDMFYFGRDDKDCYLVFKEDGIVKYYKFDKSFLKKVDETIWLKRELRKIKTYLSIKNTIPRNEVIDLLWSKFKYRYHTCKDYLTYDDEIRNDLIREISIEIQNWTNND